MTPLVAWEFQLVDDSTLHVRAVSSLDNKYLKDYLFDGRVYDQLAGIFLNGFLEEKELVPVGLKVTEVYSSQRIDYEDVYHYHIYFGISSDVEDSDHHHDSVFVQLEIPRNEFPVFTVKILSYRLDSMTSDFKKGCSICSKWIPHPLDLAPLRVPKGFIGWPRQMYTSKSVRDFLLKNTKKISRDRFSRLKNLIGPKTLRRVDDALAEPDVRFSRENFVRPKTLVETELDEALKDPNDVFRMWSTVPTECVGERSKVVCS